MSQKVGPIDTIYGNLKGLKTNQIKQLKRLYQQHLPSDRLTTPEFAQRIAAISAQINQGVSVYLNRRGQVIRVGVGNPQQTRIPLLELPRYGARRLCGIRCITTTLKDTPPNEASLTAMTLQRLDALLTLSLTGAGQTQRGRGATGYTDGGFLAHLIPEENGDRYWQVSPWLPLRELEQEDFFDLVENLEAEFERQYTARHIADQGDQVLIVGLQMPDQSDRQFTDTLTELERLIDTAGGQVLTQMIQKRNHPQPKTVIGKGKVEEIALKVQTLGATLVVFDRELTPVQVRNLEREFGVRVVDRTEVILDIFAQRARTKAGKLQVELAQLAYMLPRLMGRGQAMSRLGGGIGTRGPGETKLETERRTIQSRLSKLQKEVTQLQAHRSRMRQQRQSQEVPSVAIVGYTNAGKSTLLNALTNAEIYTADQLFATLDPTTRRLAISQGPGHPGHTVLLTDTVGFIHELPPSLVDAFRATLEEVTEADALLHVVDLSHPAWESQIASVETILEEMPLSPGPSLLVFNKLDRVDSDTLAIATEKYPEAVFIAAAERRGLETLRQRILALMAVAGP